MKKFNPKILTILLCTSTAIVAEAQEKKFFFFDKETATELYQEGVEYKEDGKLRRAQRRFKKAINEAPENELMPNAQKYVAEIYVERGKFEKAREAYEELLETYGAHTNYDEVLNSLNELAKKEEESHHFRFLFGGFASPTDAVPTYEMIVKYGPATDLAPKSQLTIGDIYRSEDKLSEAAAAYDAVLFRYPSSPEAEIAAIAKVETLYELSLKQKNNETAREDAWVACKLFISQFPESASKAKIEDLAVKLYLARAEDVYNKAVFYDTKAFKPDSAEMYYKIVINQFSESAYAEKAKEKLAELEKKGAKKDA